MRRNKSSRYKFFLDTPAKHGITLGSITDELNHFLKPYELSLKKNSLLAHAIFFPAKIRETLGRASVFCERDDNIEVCCDLSEESLELVTQYYNAFIPDSCDFYQGGTKLCFKSKPLNDFLPLIKNSLLGLIQTPDYAYVYRRLSEGQLPLYYALLMKLNEHHKDSGLCFIRTNVLEIIICKITQVNYNWISQARHENGNIGDRCQLESMLDVKFDLGVDKFSAHKLVKNINDKFPPQNRWRPARFITGFNNLSSVLIDCRLLLSQPFLNESKRVMNELEPWKYQKIQKIMTKKTMNFKEEFTLNILKNTSVRDKKSCQIPRWRFQVQEVNYLLK